MADQRTAVVYLARKAEGPEPLNRFVAAYRGHAAGAPHDFVVVFKGFGETDPDLAHAKVALADLRPRELTSTTKASILPHISMRRRGSSMRRSASSTRSASLTRPIGSPSCCIISGGTMSAWSVRPDPTKACGRRWTSCPRSFGCARQNGFPGTTAWRAISAGCWRANTRPGWPNRRARPRGSASVASSRHNFHTRSTMRTTPSTGTLSRSPMPRLTGRRNSRNSPTRTSARTASQSHVSGFSISDFRNRVEDGRLPVRKRSQISCARIRRALAILVVGKDGVGYGVRTGPAAARSAGDKANILVTDNQVRNFKKYSPEERATHVLMTWRRRCRRGDRERSDAWQTFPRASGPL